MTFMVDDDRHIVDPDRLFRLVLVQSEKEGAHVFRLGGSDFEISFCAYRSVARIEDADPDLPAPRRTLVTWTVTNIYPPPDLSREDTLPIIAEAMTAYRFDHGGPEGQLVHVTFQATGTGTRPSILSRLGRLLGWKPEPLQPPSV